MLSRLGVFALIAGLVAGCTGDGSGGPARSPVGRSSAVRSVTATAHSSSSPRHSPSSPSTPTGVRTTGPNVRPGEKPPTYPALARERSAQGALALAIYFFRAYDWGYATNDGSLVAGVSESNCRGCMIYVKGLASLRDNRQILTGGRIRLPSSSVSRNHYRERGEYVAEFVIDEDPVILTGPSGMRTASPAIRNHHSLVFLVWHGDRWKVAEVDGK